MELFEYHFNNLPKNGCLFYDETRNTYEQFSNIGTPQHVNYLTFKELFKNITQLNKKDLLILESGIASAGTNSTYLFNEYVRKYGGRFWSVDINSNLVNRHIGNMCPATTLVCNDSVIFFDNWAKKNEQADVIYLDSYDLDFDNPNPSGEHGLKEYKALLPVCKKDTLLLIDDTPVNPYWLPFRNDTYNRVVSKYNSGLKMPGKGMYVLDEEKNADLLLHNYQVLYKFK